ncbi:type 1 glutamine amidotransferase [Aliiroseovarius sp. YM-037]|uniref:type 1 glutamine amidotransferase n=1 Tax=Aliiroseovarius sp. YM-037 TaxID=3341728 RepID=UPI003A803D7E
MTKRPLKVGILETGRPPEELIHYGDYPGMVADWLSPLEAEFQSYAVLDGEFPESAEMCDLWVITGSKFGAYEAHDWIPPLEVFIRSARDAGKKMVGICFGHQIIAQALGGTVVKSDKGWGLGVHQYAPVNWPNVLGAPPEKIAIQAYHQDQVTALPKGAERIAQSDFCENAALWYPGFALTVQGHPEFAGDYTADLLELRRGTVLSDEDVETGKANMARPDNRGWLAELLNDHLDML